MEQGTEMRMKKLKKVLEIKKSCKVAFIKVIWDMSRDAQHLIKIVMKKELIGVYQIIQRTRKKSLAGVNIEIIQIYHNG